MTFKKTTKPLASSIIFVFLCSLSLIAFSQFGCEPFDEDISLEDSEGGSGVRGIVGGETTNYEEWKSVVALVAQQGMYASICTGTFISPQVILTAGHCVYYPNEGIDAVAKPTSIQVVGGANIFRFSKKINFPKVQKVIKHSSWRGTLNISTAVDLAMVKLEKPVPGIYSHPVRSTPLARYDEGTIVGYGLDGDNETTSGIHRAGATTVLRVYQRVIELGYPSGTCKGDSGGPFFTTEKGEDVVSGVTSFGTSNTCYANGGGYSVNVHSYRSWIDNTLQTLVGYDLDNVPDSPPVEEPEPDDDPEEEPGDPGDNVDPGNDNNSDDTDKDEGDENNGADNGDGDGADSPDVDDPEPNSVRSSSSCRMGATTPANSHLLQLVINLLN